MPLTPYTVLDLKKAVAAQLGKTDYATANTVRDIKINDSRREVYGAAAWSFLKKTVTISWVQDVDLRGTYAWPTYYTPEYDLGKMYDVIGGVEKYYTEVALEDLPNYSINSTSDYVFALDYENQKITSNQNSSTTTKFTYTQFPRDWALDATDDAQTEPATPAVFTAIVLLSVAEYWLAAERDEDNYDRFYKRYVQQMQLAQANDNRSGPARAIRHSNTGLSLGFNNNNPSDF